MSEECALLFALDLAYVPNAVDNTFQFGEPRAFAHRYDLPHWLRQPTDVFRVDADGSMKCNGRLTAEVCKFSMNSAETQFLWPQNQPIFAPPSRLGAKPRCNRSANQGRRKLGQGARKIVWESRRARLQGSFGREDNNILPAKLSRVWVKYLASSSFERSRLGE